MYTKYKLGAAAIIRDKKGLILLVKHSYGRFNWELPGGGQESGESIIDTVLREVHEETGLIVTPKYTTGIYYQPETGMHHFVFLCEPEDGNFDNLSIDNDEITEYNFFKIEDLPRPINDFTIRRITDYVSGVILPLPAIIPTRTWFE